VPTLYISIFIGSSFCLLKGMKFFRITIALCTRKNKEYYAEYNIRQCSRTIPRFCRIYIKEIKLSTQNYYSIIMAAVFLGISIIIFNVIFAFLVATTTQGCIEIDSGLHILILLVGWLSYYVLLICLMFEERSSSRVPKNRRG
jgi:hypothetical protein